MAGQVRHDNNTEKRVNQLFKGLCAFLYEVKIEEYEREQEFGEIKDFKELKDPGQTHLILTNFKY